jgi:hypothetical protein
MYLERDSSVRPRRSTSSHSEWHRRASARVLGLLVLLGSVPLAGCEDIDGRRSDRSGDFREGSFRSDGWRGRGSRDRDGFWHGRHGRGARGGANDAGDAGLDDAGVDDAGAADGAGLTADAGLGGSAASTGADAGLGAVAAGVADAGLAPGIQALSDGQILQVADTLLGGSIDQMNATLSLLGDAGVLGFAEQTLAEDSAARSTLSALRDVIGASPADSAVADEARTINDAALQELAVPDAGAIDARFMSAQLAAEARDLALLGQLLGAADAPVLRAQLVVLQALRQAQLERARAIAADL